MKKNQIFAIIAIFFNSVVFCPGSFGQEDDFDFSELESEISDQEFSNFDTPNDEVFSSEVDFNEDDLEEEFEESLPKDDFVETEDFSEEQQLEPVVESSPPPEENKDPPSLTYEAQLHNIYLNFYQKPIPDIEWDFLVGEKASESYHLQKGDTLWDLSVTFFGDGNFWPKIWSINSKITNPHLIEPGHTIHFIMGDENNAPMFTISEAEDLSVDLEIKKLPDVDEGESIEESEVSDEELFEEYLTDEDIEDIVIPPPTMVIRPVAKNFPPSLPRWKSIGEQLLQSLKVELSDFEIKNIAPLVPVTFYLDENQPEGVGRVVEIEQGSQVASQYQYIFVRVKAGLVTPGQRYVVVSNKGPLTTNKGPLDNAIIWEVQGMVEIVDKLKPKKAYASSKFELYRAFVVSTLSAITKDSQLLNEEYTVVKFDTQGNQPPVSGAIIGGEFDNKRNIATTRTLVYLNRGAHDGLKSGDILPIYANREIDNKDSYVLTTNNPTGLIKVARVSEFYATGYVVENNGMINVGDFVGVSDDYENANTNVRQPRPLPTVPPPAVKGPEVSINQIPSEESKSEPLPEVEKTDSLDSEDEDFLNE